MTSRISRSRLRWRQPALLFLLVIAPSIGLGQSKAPAPLPPAAQEALDKGLIATKVPDYLLAIRFFEEARTLAPEAPIIYLNLGLAEFEILDANYGRSPGLARTSRPSRRRRTRRPCASRSACLTCETRATSRA